MHRYKQQGFTLIELVIVMVVSGILFVVTPPLLFHGVKTLVFMPRAVAVNQAAAEVMHQLVEGGFSILAGQTTVRGPRFAVGRGTGVPAIWLTEANRIGFLTSDGQYVLLRLDTAGGDVMKRSVLPATPTCSSVPAAAEEDIPYHAAGNVRIITTTGVLFRYYNQSQVELAPSCPPNSAIRRVDIEFVGQTGNGVFDEGHARQPMKTSVAIRIP